MEKLSKPILYNNFRVNDKLTIVKRLEESDLSEVYILSDNTYLFLFKNLERDQILNDNKNILEIELDEHVYLGIIDNNYSTGRNKEIYSDLTNLKGLASVAGMHDLKLTLINDVVNPLNHPEKYKKFKLSIPNGILLFGPPGCGKTFIVQKLAEELNRTFIEIKHSDVGSPYIYGAVNNLGRIFDIARQKSPSIVFIDELSGLAPKRESLVTSTMHKEEEVNELLMQLNKASEHNVLVVGATNHPERIDSAVLRPGRMDKIIYVPMPDSEARKELFKMYLQGRPYNKDIDFNELAKLTEGFTATDVELVVENTARHAVAENKPEISKTMLLSMLKNTQPSISKEEADRYKQYLQLERW